MKTKRQLRPTCVLRIELRNGQLILHLSVPTRWLVIFGGALAGSVPLIQLLETLSRMLH
jgi:hypothetical protein